MEAGSLRARRVSSESFVLEDRGDGSALYGKLRLERPYNGEGGDDDDAFVEELEGARESEIWNGLQARKLSYLGRDERWKWWKVYALHFLFMWNTRTYEYASVS
jgi:hypothetical protein